MAGRTSEYDALQQRVGRILQLHLDAAKICLNRIDREVEEVQDNGLVGTEVLAQAQVRQQGIANLSSRACNANL